MAGQVIEVRTHIDHGVHGQHGEDDSGEGHARNAPNHISAGVDADGRGKDQVAGAEEDGEHGKAQDKNIFRPALFHDLASLS